MGGLTLLLHTASGSRHYKTIPLALAKSHLKSLLASEGGSDDLDCCCVFCRTIAKQTFEKEESSEGRKKKIPCISVLFFNGDFSWYQDTWADRPIRAAADSRQKILTGQKGQLATKAVPLPPILSPWDGSLVGLLGFNTTLKQLGLPPQALNVLNVSGAYSPSLQMCTRLCMCQSYSSWGITGSLLFHFFP